MGGERLQHRGILLLVATEPGRRQVRAVRHRMGATQVFAWYDLPLERRQDLRGRRQVPVPGYWHLVRGRRASLAEPQLQGQLEDDCDVVSQNGYTGYNHKDSESPSGQRHVTVGGSNGQWHLCAEQCHMWEGCQGWTYVYNGRPGVSSWDCYLKPALDTMHCDMWKREDTDISGLRQ